MEKSYDPKKFRRKIPKVGRSYKRHQIEKKTFDKSNNINDLVEEIIMGTKSNEDNTMAKSIENEIDSMADNMAKSTIDPKAELMATIKELGPVELKKSLADLSDEQKGMVVEILEEMNKATSMDANYSPDKKFAKLANMGTEEETGSDDSDEKLVVASNKDIKHQGDDSPEGKSGQVIKSESETIDDIIEKAMYKNCDKEQVEEAHQNMMDKDKKDYKKGYKKGKGYDMAKSLEDALALKNEIIKSYEDAGLAYTDELVKGEMKKRMNPEEDQVIQPDATKGKSTAKKESVPNIEVAKDASETADEVKVPSIKKSLPGFDPQSRLRANTGGRNFHFSIDNFYNEALAKAQGKDTTKEELSKGETEESVDDINDIIEKGFDKTMCNVAEEELQKSQIMGEFAQSSFSDKDFADAMNISEAEYKELMGN